MHKYDLVNSENSYNDNDDKMSNEDIEITKKLLEI